MKQICKKVTNVLGYVYGTGIAVSLLTSGLSFLGYCVALIVGGDAAEMICSFIYKTVYPPLIYWTSVVVLIGLLKMYLSGEKTLTSSKNNSNKINTTPLS